ncbi:hypothetical protein QL285_096056 [Trifolium repens]|nr:hypothetical protein QL285_096056 [Trifolium repens]
MVQFMGSKNVLSESVSNRENIPVKFEIEDHLEEQHAPLHKRCKQWSASNDASLSSHSQVSSILDEPSPLGLCLRKSVSLLELIQMKLSQGNTVIANKKDDSSNSGSKKDSRASVEKLKASNFPAMFLKIGSWEYKSKYEGDLVAKCYFAKEKLVWEVLEGELKSKIEIQWSDITALKANCPEDGPSSLTLVVARQPLFFRETNPQPRKHTLWQSTTDFTGGQASKHRKHFLQCEQGLLTKHFEKLIQCSLRLDLLSKQPEIILDSPYFDTQFTAFEKPDNLKDCDLHQVNGKGSATTRFQNTGSPHSSSLSPSFTIENSDPSAITLDSVPCEAPSSSSEGIYCSEADSKGPRNLDQIKLPGLRHSMSVSDFIDHVQHHLSEGMDPGNPSFSAEILDCQKMLDDLTQHLFNDNQVTAPSDDPLVMSKVNSLCCLLKLDPQALDDGPNDGKKIQLDNQVTASDGTSHMPRVNSLYCFVQMDPPAAVQNSLDEEPNDGENIQLGHDLESMQGNRIKKDIKAAAEEDSRDVYGGNPTSGMSRIDSYTNLLLDLPRIESLPRIASLSRYLNNISED